MPLICIDCRYIGPRPSGIAKVVQALVDFIPSAAPDLDFLLLRHPRAPRPLSHGGNVSEIEVNASANSPTTMWWLPWAANISKVDLFHATYNIMPRGLAMPCLTTIHDIMWLTAPEWCNTRWSGAAERWFYQHGIKRALKRSAAIGTVSEASRRAIIDYAPAAADRVHVAQLGVSADYRPTAASTEFLTGLGLPAGKRFVLTVGQYVPYKNHEGAARIFARIADAHQDCDLVFVQRMSRRSARLRSLVAALGIANRVHFLPATGDAELTALLSAAAALLHPSFCEGFGLPLLEAMACGCPVVTGARSAMAEVVGDAGLLAQPDDLDAMASALHSVLSNTKVRADLIRKGFLRASGMRWENFARANLDLYRKLL